jgi:hypothetical protein
LTTQDGSDKETMTNIFAQRALYPFLSVLSCIEVNSIMSEPASFEERGRTDEDASSSSRSISNELPARERASVPLRQEMADGKQGEKLWKAKSRPLGMQSTPC